jgi:hypothetical protein
MRFFVARNAENYGLIVRSFRTSHASPADVMPMSERRTRQKSRTVRTLPLLSDPNFSLRNPILIGRLNQTPILGLLVLGAGRFFKGEACGIKPFLDGLGEAFWIE